MTVATLRPHTAAVVAALEVAGLTVGLGARPDDAGSKYVVLYPMGRDLADNLADPHTGFEYTVQVVAVGVNGPEQAEWVGDKARTALLAPLTITGRTWLGVTHDPGQPLTRDDSIDPAVFFTSETFRIRTA